MADLGGNGYLWPDADGTATALANTSFAASDVTPRLDLSGRLMCQVTVAGVDATAIELKAEVSWDEGTSWEEWQRKTIPGAVIGTHYATLDLPDKAEVRLSLRRWGGSASTTASVFARARHDLGTPGRNGQPIELAAAAEDGVLAWHSGGSAQALSTQHITGDWIPVGEATEATLRGTISSASSMTSCDVRIDVSPDYGTTVIPHEAVNSVSGGSVDIDNALNVLPGTDGEYMRRIPVSPDTAIRVAAKKTDGTASLLGRIYLRKV